MTSNTAGGAMPIRALTEQDRKQRAEETGGQPILDFAEGGNPFVNYLAVDRLLSLQNPRTKANSEPAFLIMSQVMELLFKLVHGEAAKARDLLDADDVRGALWVLRRTHRVQRTLSGTWEVLGALSPVDYGEFRDDLGEGSGFQSYMYRQLEFILGNKNPAMLNPHRNSPEVHAELSSALAEPSLYDAALRLLHRRGLPLPLDCAERDWARPYQERPEVVEAWRVVYADIDGHFDLHQLGEALVDLAFEFGHWRSMHVLTVERVLGAKVGTGGTTGVKWLRRVADHRFFPELWQVRSALD